jgi:predicted phage tail protein
MILLSAIMLAGQPSTASSKTEEILSLIAPEKYYRGLDVQDAIRSLLEVYRDELEATSRAAAEAAVKPCVADLAGARAGLQAAIGEREGWKTVAVAAVAGCGFMAILAAVGISLALR